MLKKLSEYPILDGFNRVQSALIKENSLAIHSQDEFARLFPDLFRTFNDFDFLLENITPLINTDKFVKKINSWDKSKPICVLADYDVDGITACLIMLYTLDRLGYRVMFGVPDRLQSGYGMNSVLVQSKIDAGAELFITVDNGITGREVTDYIHSKGKEIIITDHHLPDPSATPLDSLIIDPKYNDDEFTDSCGAVVALKLCYVLAKSNAINIDFDMLGVLGGVATIADMMPLLGENREIVKLTLDKIDAHKRKFSFIHSFIYKFGGWDDFYSKPEYVATEDLISFSIAPSINAVSRVNGKVDELISALFELMEDNNADIPSFTAYNITRKKETKDLLMSYKSDPRFTHSTVFVYDNGSLDFNAKGIYGILANKINKRDNVVALIGATRVGDDSIIDLSGRSFPGYNLYEGFTRIKEKHPDWELSGGGHAAAMGMHIKNDPIILEAFKAELEQDVIANSEEIPEEVLFEYEPEMEDEIISTISQFRFFGNGFNQLLFSYTGPFTSYDFDSKDAVVGEYIFKRYLSKYTKPDGSLDTINFKLYFGNSNMIEFKEVRK